MDHHEDVARQVEQVHEQLVLRTNSLDTNYTVNLLQDLVFVEDKQAIEG